MERGNVLDGNGGSRSRGSGGSGGSDGCSGGCGARTLKTSTEDWSGDCCETMEHERGLCGRAECVQGAWSAELVCTVGGGEGGLVIIFLYCGIPHSRYPAGDPVETLNPSRECIPVQAVIFRKGYYSKNLKIDNGCAATLPLYQFAAAAPAPVLSNQKKTKQNERTTREHRKESNKTFKRSS